MNDFNMIPQRLMCTVIAALTPFELRSRQLKRSMVMMLSMRRTEADLPEAKAQEFRVMTPHGEHLHIRDTKKHTFTSETHPIVLPVVR